jgi:hypothetical protein
MDTLPEKNAFLKRDKKKGELNSFNSIGPMSIGDRRPNRQFLPVEKPQLLPVLCEIGENFTPVMPNIPIYQVGIPIALLPKRNPFAVVQKDEIW